MANILAALKRHNIYRVAAAYAVVAWVLGQLVSILMPIFDLPQWIARAFLLLLAFGFPVALFFAWANQLAPESGGAARVSTGKLDWFLAGALVVVIALMSYQQLAPTRTAESQQSGVVAARAASVSPAGAISIAVLPFLNLSSDKEQDFFSDGITEEITAALAKVPDLRVVARTSAFEFKGKNVNIKTMGAELGATHLIEGSVRKAGDRLRITAQLIKADDGTHIWAEDYDRELTDVFAVQEDVARAITASLHMTLSLKPGENLINQRTKDASVYEEYLRGKMLVRANLPEAIRLLNDVVSRDPNYAPAWGVLARANTLSLLANPAVLFGLAEATPIVRDYAAKAVIAAQTAYRLDPNNSDAVYAYSELDTLRGRANSPQRVELLERALALDPDNPEPLNSYSLDLAALGFTKQALKVREHLVAVEPFVPGYRNGLARLLVGDGQFDAAVQMVKGAGGNGALLRAQASAALGRFAEAADALAEIKADSALQEVLTNAIRILRGAPATAAPNDRPELGILDWIYIYRGAPERLAQEYETRSRAGLPGGQLTGLQFTPGYTAMRKTQAFKQYIRESGAIEYWRAKGWPPQCHPTTGDDFECN